MKSLQRLAFLSVLLLAASCGQNNAQNSSQNSSPSPVSPSPSPTVEPSPTPVPSGAISNPTSTGDQSLAAGEYCFAFKDQKQEGSVKLVIGSDRQVNGTAEGVIQDAENGYFTSYNQEFLGQATAQKLQLDITTQIEQDTQQEQKVWTVTGNQLDTGRLVYTQQNCQTVATESGVKEERLKFATGATSTLVEDSVIRGERRAYLAGAQANQDLRVSITSLENNAVFDLVSPTGESMIQEATSATVSLPATGDYSIVVGGTRGNASYKLQVEIK